MRDAGLRERPGDRQLAVREAVLPGDRPHPVEHLAYADARLSAEQWVMAAQIVFREDARGIDLTGQQPIGQGRVRQHRNVVLRAIGQILVFQSAMEHAVLLLRSIHRPDRPVSPQLVERAIGDSDRTDLALLFQVEKRAHRLFDRCRGVLPMCLVEVDIVGLEPLQALFDFVPYGFRAQVAMNVRAILIDKEGAFRGVPD